MARYTRVEAIMNPGVVEHRPSLTKGYVTLCKLPLKALIQCISGIIARSIDEGVLNNWTRFKIVTFESGVAGQNLGL